MAKSDKNIWGSTAYLIDRYADIDKAHVVQKSSTDFKSIKRIIDAVSNDKNNAYLYEVIKTEGTWDTEPRKMTIAHIVLGLNGPGKQCDYLTTVAKLVRSGKVSVIDDNIDACDDLWDFLLVFKDTKDSKERKTEKKAEALPDFDVSGNPYTIGFLKTAAAHGITPAEITRVVLDLCNL